VDAHVPHDYVTGDRLRLEAYRKIAEAPDEDAIDSVLDELVDRYGEPPTPVRNLLAVAAFRQRCRAMGVGEVAVAGNNIRIGPMELPDSAQLKLRRLYPKAQYKPAAKLVTVPRPVEGGRIGGAPLRDVALLDWCASLIGQVLTPGVPARV
jgi:transcription-repair coupling factor (superfamily II helicase)